MSSFNSDVKNENENFKKSEKKRVFTKEMLKELLNKKLNQRILKLENTSKEHISNLNYTSKYFKEFSKAIQQLYLNLLILISYYILVNYNSFHHLIHAFYH